MRTAAHLKMVELLGVYDNFPFYAIQDGKDYVIAAASNSNYPTLPTFKDETGFLGWYFGETNVTDYLKNHATYTLDLSQGKTLEARWEAKEIYEVNLDPCYGSLPAGSPDPIKVYAGNTIEALPTPRKTIGNTEYEFLGWYTKASGGDKVDYSFTPEADCDLYAHWAEKVHTVTFDPNGGIMYLPDDGSTNVTKTVSDNGTVSALPGANRKGYYLDGWTTNADGTGDIITTSTQITDDATYYAKWTEAKDTYVTPAGSDGLYKYSVKWETPSNEYATNMGDTLIVAPSNGNSDISVRLFVNFIFNKEVSISTGGVLPEYSVKIRIPKYVFENKNGEGIGTINIDSGFSQTDTSDSHFIYGVDPEDPDYYIITNTDVNTAAIFENDTYPKTSENDPQDYHLYAKWIKVDTVPKDSNDANLMDNDYRGFGLEGVQVRLPDMADINFNTQVKPGGLRFVTSLSKVLYESIYAISSTGVEYGYVAATEKNIDTFTSQYEVKDLTKYKLQYQGDNVNGVNTTGKTKTAETDYRYVTNVNCTSRVGNNSSGVVDLDHRNFADYRLYTLVVTYDDIASANNKGDKIDARAYIRYTDANGKLRVFYNDYKKNMYYGGCLCSYNQVANMAIPQDQEMLDEQQQVP